MLVSGKVTNFDALGIPGVIVHDDMGNGTQTDVNGIYYLEVDPNGKLKFEYFGISKEVNVEGESTINVTINDSPSTSEVVITASRPNRSFFDTRETSGKIALFLFALAVLFYLKRYWF